MFKLKTRSSSYVVRPFYLKDTFCYVLGAPYDSCKVKMLKIGAWELGLPETVSVMLSVQMIQGIRTSVYPSYSISLS